MKLERLLDPILWSVNLLLAFGIVAFAFLFVIFPRPENLEARHAVSLADGAGANLAERPPIDAFRPCWKKLSEPPRLPPEPPKGPPLKERYKFTGTQSASSGSNGLWAILYDVTADREELFQVGNALDGGYRIVEIRHESVTAERTLPDGTVDRQTLVP